MVEILQNTVVSKYDNVNIIKDFFDISKGLENLPERSERCYRCYELRLRETAKIADEFNFKYFSNYNFLNCSNLRR